MADRDAQPSPSFLTQSVSDSLLSTPATSYPHFLQAAPQGEPEVALLKDNDLPYI